MTENPPKVPASVPPVVPAASTTDEPQKARSNVLFLTIKDKTVLYASYMPFLEGGGLFIPTQKPYAMGESVAMVLNLMDDPEKYPVTGEVVWVTPKGAQNNRQPGMGVQFKGEDGRTLRAKIENYLAGFLKSEQSTHTM